MSRSPRPAARPSAGPARSGRAAPARGGGASPDPDFDRRALREAADSLGLALDDAQLAQLLAYLALLRKWNAVYNLTAIRDPGAMLVQHLFDCLAIVPALRGTSALDDPAAGQRSGPDLLGPGAVVLDVGSGGGLPGVVLAICAPQARVWCVDTVGKKAAFLTQVRAELGLANLHAIHARVEQLQAPRDLPAPTLVVSRAFASLALFVSLTRHLIAPGGTWAAMKGQLPDEELEALPAGVRLSSAITLTVPRLDARRHLLLLGA